MFTQCTCEEADKKMCRVLRLVNIKLNEGQLLNAVCPFEKIDSFHQGAVAQW